VRQARDDDRPDDHSLSGVRLIIAYETGLVRPGLS
jgi:hypothetical protein